MRRHQLAVAPRITIASLTRAAISQLDSRGIALQTLSSTLMQEFSAADCVLTDSGTSALVLALRLMLPKNGVIGLPSYGCVDISSAVRFAGLRVRLYDIDPNTLSPDLESVSRALKRGVHALLVAHYYGYPADVPGVRALASNWGVPVLEDAAQAAGGALNGVRLGALGEISILSFGRGKGLFGGRGGAVLVRSSEWSRRLAAERVSLGFRRGVPELLAAGSQWIFGRPSLYSIPASLPFLRLGEMVYHPAHEPGVLSQVSATLARIAVRNEAQEKRLRVRKATVLRALAEGAEQLSAIPPIEGSEPGYLRFAVVDHSGSRLPAHRLGIMRGYPQTLSEQPELAPQLLRGEPPMPGAHDLRRSLFTLPTHAFVQGVDMMALQDWMCSIACETARSVHTVSAMVERPALSEGWSQ